MAVELDISWEGRSASDFARSFDVAANIKSFRPALQEIGQKVVAPSISVNFQVGGRPAWRPLSESTIERKSRAGYDSPSKILVATGAMEAAATNPGNYKVTDDELRAAPFGIDYWGFHQAGSGVPQRVIMMLQSLDRTKVNKIFADYLRQFMTFRPGLATTRPFTGGRSGA